jgi:hypothetical protein
MWELSVDDELGGLIRVKLATIHLRDRGGDIPFVRCAMWLANAGKTLLHSTTPPLQRWFGDMGPPLNSYQYKTLDKN